MQKDFYLSLDERLLFQDAFNITTSEYLINSVKFNEYLKKYNNGYSIASIIKKKEFYGIEFYVDENVLIPRPETETLVEKALCYIDELKINKNKKEKIKVLDLCTGSGCVGLSIKKLSKDTDVTLLDISEKALNVARINKERLNLDVNIIKSDLFQNINDKFDIIVSNPPYVKTTDINMLSKSVLKEPHLALFAGESGLDVIKMILNDVNLHLNNNSYLIIEMAIEQCKAVSKLITSGLTSLSNCKTTIINDLTGRSRFVEVQKF